MALAMYFSPPSGFSAAQYDDVDQALDAVGARTPEGRLYHTCFGDGDRMQVFDIWESQEAFNKFGETLLPILAERGIDPGEPMVAPIHNTIPG
jgi:hypothetical protein